MPARRVEYVLTIRPKGMAPVAGTYTWDEIRQKLVEARETGIPFDWEVKIKGEGGSR